MTKQEFQIRYQKLLDEGIDPELAYFQVSVEALDEKLKESEKTLVQSLIQKKQELEDLEATIKGELVEGEKIKKQKEKEAKKIIEDAKQEAKEEKEKVVGDLKKLRERAFAEIYGKK